MVNSALRQAAATGGWLPLRRAVPFLHLCDVLPFSFIAIGLLVSDIDATFHNAVNEKISIAKLFLSTGGLGGSVEVEIKKLLDEHKYLQYLPKNEEPSKAASAITCLPCLVCLLPWA